MSADAFIDSLILELRRRDIRLTLKGGEIGVDAPKGALQQEDVLQLRAHKSAIVDFLRRYQRRFEPPPLQRLPDLDAVPLSLAQQRLWIVDQLAGPQGAMRYHVPSSLRMRGALDADALRRALDALIQRHEVLRSTMSAVEGVPILSIRTHAEFPLQTIDLSGRAAEDREAALHRRLQQEVQTSFDLGTGPLIRGCLMRVSDEEHVLFVTKHHIVSDGWSADVMWREICAMYEAFSCGQSNPLPPVSIRYSDYARWQRDWLRGPVLADLLGYWRKQLSQVPQLDLRVDRLRQTSPTYRGAVAGFVIDEDAGAVMRALAAESGASLFMVMFAVFHLLLSRIGGQRDFTVSTAVAGRNHPGTESLVGPCVNNLLLRVAATRGMTYRRFLERVRDVVLEAYAHQDMPYEELVAELRAEGGASTPVAFVMGAAKRNAAQLGGLGIEPVVLPWSTAKNELTLSMQDAAREIYGVFEYATDVFEPATIERLGRRFRKAVARIVVDPDIPLDAIDLSLDEDDDDAAYFHSSRYLDDRAYWARPRPETASASLAVVVNARGQDTRHAVSLVLDEALAHALSTLADRRGTLLSELLQSAFLLYLHKACGLDALCVGIAAPLAGEAVPIDVELLDGDTLQAYVERCRELFAGVARHGGCGAALIHRIQGGDASGSARFKTVIEGARSAEPIGGDVELRIGIETGDAASVRFSADARAFERWEIDAHLRAFRTLLAQLPAIDAAQAPLRGLALLDGADLAQVLAWSEGLRTPLPTEQRIEALFEARAASSPDAVAIRHGVLDVDYRALNARANRIARTLAGMGVRPGAFVVVCLERGVDLIASLLAVLKCGAACVPIDPAVSSERLRFIVGDADPVAIVSTSALLRDLPAPECPVLALDAQCDAIDTQSEADLPRIDTASHDAGIAWLIYTSGSTGAPKGVMIEHRNLINHAMWAQREFPIAADDRALQFATISFDASIEEILPTLFAGACIVVRSQAVPSAQELLEQIVAQGVTILNLPTAYWHAFVEALAGERIRTGALRLIIVGGERVSLESLLRWRSIASSDIAWLNTYGPTEAAISSTCYRAPRELDGLSDIPIGRPIDNAAILLLDREGRPVPAGVVGELFIGGAGVAAGYLGRAELSAEKFIRNGSVSSGVARLYSSGDLARWLPNGDIAYVGRNDDQVKIRGFRIEPGEIEALLRTRPGVREAAVVVREDAPGDKRLVAYVTCDDGLRDAFVEDLRVSLSTHLPEYMMPAAFVVLDALPMTLNGKLDRRALPAPAIAGAGSGAHELPHGSVEVALARILEDILGIERVGRHDNYFELGGSSISAIQFIGRANRVGLKLTLNMIFEHRTVAAIAAQLGRVQGATGLSGAAASRKRQTHQAPERGAVEGPLPFTPIQRSVLQQGEDSVRHLMSTQVLSCRRTLDPELLAIALRKLVWYHDALRLRIARDESGAWSQSIAPIAAMDDAVPLTCERFDPQGGETGAQIDAALKRLRDRIDIERGALLQATLIDASADGQLLLLGAHHFAVDPISWAILLQDLQSVYEQLEADAPVRLPVKGSSFKHWAEGLQAHADSPAADADAAYWRAMDWEAHVRLPVEREREGEGGGETVCVTVELDEHRTRALLDAASHVHGAQTNELLLAALACALWQWSGMTEFAMGMYHHGRVAGIEGLDVSRTLGWFSAPVPMLLRVADGGAPVETLDAVKQRLRSMPNEGVGYGILRHFSQRPERLPEAHIDVLLNHQGTVAGETSGGLFSTHFDNRRYAEVLREAELPWKLTVLSNIANDRLSVNILSLWYSRATLQSVADSFEAMLCGVADQARTHGR